MVIDSAEHIRSSRKLYFLVYITFSLAAIGVGLAARVLMPELMEIGNDREMALPLLSVQLFAGYFSRHGFSRIICRSYFDYRLANLILLGSADSGFIPTRLKLLQDGENRHCIGNGYDRGDRSGRKYQCFHSGELNLVYARREFGAPYCSTRLAASHEWLSRDCHNADWNSDDLNLALRSQLVRRCQRGVSGNSNGDFSLPYLSVVSSGVSKLSACRIAEAE